MFSKVLTLLACFSHSHSKDDCPRQNDDIISLAQSVDRIIDKVEEEIAQDLTDALWGTDLRAGSSQLDGHRKDIFGEDSDKGSRKSPY